MKEIFYFLLGAVGAIFALLFAPQSGEELRARYPGHGRKRLAKSAGTVEGRAGEAPRPPGPNAG